MRQVVFCEEITRDCFSLAVLKVILILGRMQTKKEILDAAFMPARIQLLEIAAFLDRLDRSEGEADCRLDYFKKAIPLLLEEGTGRTQSILNMLSYDGDEPVEKPVLERAWGVPVK